VGSGDDIRRSSGHTSKDIAKYLGVSRATLYRYLAAWHDSWQRDLDGLNAIAVAVVVAESCVNPGCDDHSAYSIDGSARRDGDA